LHAKEAATAGEMKQLAADFADERGFGKSRHLIGLSILIPNLR
jgi:hypothetical protein